VWLLAFQLARALLCAHCCQQVLSGHDPVSRCKLCEWAPYKRACTYKNIIHLLFLVQVTEWAAQVVEVLREEVGAEALAASMNSARGNVSAAKAKRKRAVALQAVVDPEAAAQRRLRRNEKRSGERKRKAVLEKRRRDAGVARSGSKRGAHDNDATGSNKRHKRRER
jgi:hypothetical protein